MVAEMKSPANLELGRAVFLNLKKLPELSADDLNIKSNGEIITLEGFVRSSDEKSAAEKAALEVPGVKAVASEIVVKQFAERPDTDIVREILREFRSNILIPANQIRLIVSNGLVTMEGEALSDFEKMITEAAVKRVRGVTGIRNNIEVKAEAM
ncbi:MAG TPA: BON domain-containing protein [Blastocatellia bacterium]|nr:BON domain-containing protein [Blastocatellia bacterium]